MPSRNIRAGDTVYVRATALVDGGGDCLQVCFDDGVKLSITSWVPSGECARYEDIGELKPPRRANPRHIER